MPPSKGKHPKRHPRHVKLNRHVIDFYNECDSVGCMSVLLYVIHNFFLKVIEMGCVADLEGVMVIAV